MHKYEQESRKLGKQSFMYAWVLDETGEERNRGITMDVGRSQFETNSKQVSHPHQLFCTSLNVFVGYASGRPRPQGLHPQHDIGCRTGGRSPSGSGRNERRVWDWIRLRRADPWACAPRAIAGREPTCSGDQQAGHGVLVAGAIRRDLPETEGVPEASRVQGEWRHFCAVQRADGAEFSEGTDWEWASVLV